MVKPVGDFPTFDHIIVGQVLQAHGVQGQIRVKVLSDVPERFDPGQTVHIGPEVFRISFSTYSGSDHALVQLDGVTTRDAALPLVGQAVTVPQTAVPSLEEGEYFYFQLLDLRVLTKEHEELGQITEILETGSNDVYVVSGPGGEVLVPALTDVVLEVRLDEGLMIVDLPDGLR